MNRNVQKMSLWSYPKRTGWQLGTETDDVGVWVKALDRIGWRQGTREFNVAIGAAEWARLARRLTNDRTPDEKLLPEDRITA